jgi:hypothetical protein
MSSSLGFSIWIPDDWTVCTDVVEELDLAAQERESQIRQRSSPEAEYEHLTEELGGPDEIVPFEEFLQRWLEDRQREEERLQLKERMGFEVGLWQAQAPKSSEGHEWSKTTEVTRLRLREGMTPMELYWGDKPFLAVYGSRPHRPLAIDGLDAVRYYHRYSADEPVFYNVYMVDALTGWILSCSCEWAGWDDWKGERKLFKCIVTSFQRIAEVPS